MIRLQADISKLVMFLFTDHEPTGILFGQTQPMPGNHATSKTTQARSTGTCTIWFLSHIAGRPQRTPYFLNLGQEKDFSTQVTVEQN